MRPLKQDLSVLKKLEFKVPPVGVKFLFFRPEAMEQLSTETNLSFCEMLTEAQRRGTPFYFSKENSEACVGKILLGMEDMAPFAESGQIGARLEIFQELARDGLGIIMATHDPELAAEADKKIEISDGRIVNEQSYQKDTKTQQEWK